MSLLLPQYEKGVSQKVNEQFHELHMQGDSYYIQ